MITLDVHVPGTPRTKGSWRPIRRKDGGVFMKPSTDEKPWAMAVAWAARAAGAVCIKKPHACTVVIAFTIARPKKSKNEFPIGDADKLLRSCLDSLTGIAWDDDVQCVDVRATKSWGDEPGARIVVSRVGLTPHAANRGGK